jgi:hypothetical protein
MTSSNRQIPYEVLCWDSQSSLRPIVKQGREEGRDRCDIPRWGQVARKGVTTVAEFRAMKHETCRTSRRQAANERLTKKQSSALVAAPNSC